MIELLFLIPFVLIMIIMTTKGYFVHKKLPPFNSEDIIFRERMASGYNNSSMINRMGGATNILDVIVTREIFIIKAPMTFMGFMPMFGLIQHSHIGNISVEEKNRQYISVIINQPDGLSTEIILKLKKKDEFLTLVKELNSIK